MDLLLPLIPHVRFYQEIWIYLTPLIFMLADIITGFSGAYITKNIVSHKMRSGIIKKCGEMVVIFLTALVCFVLGLPHQIIVVVSLYMILLETTSIFENLDKMGVPIPKWIESALNNAVNEINDGDVKKLSKDMNNYYKVARYLCDKEGTTISEILKESEEKNKDEKDH